MKSNIQFIAALAAVFSISVFTASAQLVTDAQLKKNTTPVSNSLSTISRLHPVTYEYNKSDFKQLNLPAGKQVGFIADDVKEVMPWAITTRNNWYNAGKNNPRAVATAEVDLQKLVPLLVGAIQEQQTEIEQLKQEVQLLKKGK
ncbi:tail fiber domain-containing protein [Mucilaginibacter antarcticus]|uniref:Tail fiber domain-containing protein n=1 Tax=Mucilaginibacter antarcticus TaxID=1855725 RepID=A0ABW5XV51_9SPHI